MHFIPSTVPDEAAAALEPAFRRTHTDTAEAWLERCRRDLAQLWEHQGYWAISEVINGKTCRVLHLVASAGVFNNELVDEMEAWGRSIGCKKVVAEVRRGMTRRRHGYRIKAVSVEKDL
ncbi:hypothetical protein [Delftia deserti]|uniref:Uncharacterized protein n=1 Tax=Delftia deserti TaxID=1651218 RepID=A0ABW5EMP5_9BURK